MHWLVLLSLMLWSLLGNSLQSNVRAHGLRRFCLKNKLFMSTTKITLDESTLWRLNLKLQKSGFKQSDAALRIRFVESKNYEPPQGRVFVEDDYNGIAMTDERGYSGQWTLSEDKNDRKDGLWIWGLFDEPKYPFLYFSLDVYNTTILASGQEEPIFGGNGIPKNRLNFRFSHVRDDKTRNVLLSKGEMTYQETELMNADPLGIGGKVDVGDTVDAGIVELVAVINPIGTDIEPQTPAGPV